MIRVALRFDDPGLASDHALERRILDLLERHELTSTFAVVPFNAASGSLRSLAAEHVPHLCRAATTGRIEIAQHGYSHENCAPEKGPPGEFPGLPASHQASRIRQGRACLQAAFGVPPSGFVPPWNAYDAATLASLAEAGFSYLSAGWEGAMCRRIAVLPRTCNIADVRATVEKARDRRVAAAVVGVFHHYDFLEHADACARAWSLADFDALLTWLTQQRDVQVQTLAVLAHTFTPESWLRSFWLYRAAARMPWRLQKTLPPDCLLTPPWWRIPLCLMRN